MASRDRTAEPQRSQRTASATTLQLLPGSSRKTRDEPAATNSKATSKARGLMAVATNAKASAVTGDAQKRQSGDRRSQERRVVCSVRVNPADYFTQQVGYYGPEGGENGDAYGDDARERLGPGGRESAVVFESRGWNAGVRPGTWGSDAGLRRGCGAESCRLIDVGGQMADAESIGDGGASASLTLRTEVEAGTLIGGIFAVRGCDAVTSG